MPWKLVHYDQNLLITAGNVSVTWECKTTTSNLLPVSTMQTGCSFWSHSGACWKACLEIPQSHNPFPISTKKYVMSQFVSHGISHSSLKSKIIYRYIRSAKISKLQDCLQNNRTNSEYKGRYIYIYTHTY